MTRPGTGPPADRSDGPDPEVVLSQALRALAGGRRDQPLRTAGETSGPTPRSTAGSTPGRRRVTTGQLILIAALTGLMLGILAGIISLVV